MKGMSLRNGNLCRNRAGWGLRSDWRGFHECLRWRRLLRNVYVAIFVSGAVGKILANFLGNFAEVDEAVGNVDQLGCGVRAKTRDFYPAAFVRD